MGSGGILDGGKALSSLQATSEQRVEPPGGNEPISGVTALQREERAR